MSLKAFSSFLCESIRTVERTKLGIRQSHLVLNMRWGQISATNTIRTSYRHTYQSTDVVLSKHTVYVLMKSIILE